MGQVNVANHSSQYMAKSAADIPIRTMPTLSVGPSHQVAGLPSSRGKARATDQSSQPVSNPEEWEELLIMRSGEVQAFIQAASNLY